MAWSYYIYHKDYSINIDSDDVHCIYPQNME